MSQLFTFFEQNPVDRASARLGGNVGLKPDVWFRLVRLRG